MSDFVDNRVLPAQLDGVRVYVNGYPTYISYISPYQVNALAPEHIGILTGYRGDDQSGTVEVITPSGRSEPFTANVNSMYAPGLFSVDGKYVIAQAVDGSLIGSPGSRPARPGEIVTVYGTGFGPTSPPYDISVLPTAPAQLRYGAWLVVPGYQITPLWSGVIGPGLYQLNVTLPVVPDGEYTFHPLADTASGADESIIIHH